MLAASGTSHNMRERGKDKKQRKTDCGGGGEREGGGSHIAHLQAVNNLEEHWGDKNEDEHKTLAAFDLELELHQCTSQSGESFLPLSLFLTQPSSLLSCRLLLIYVSVHLPPSVSGRKSLYAIPVSHHIL